MPRSKGSSAAKASKGKDKGKGKEKAKTPKTVMTTFPRDLIVSSLMGGTSMKIYTSTKTTTNPRGVTTRRRVHLLDHADFWKTVLKRLLMPYSYLIVGEMTLTYDEEDKLVSASAPLIDAPFKELRIEDPGLLAMFSADGQEVDVKKATAKAHPCPGFELVESESENFEVGVLHLCRYIRDEAGQDGHRVWMAASRKGWDKTNRTTKYDLVDNGDENGRDESSTPEIDANNTLVKAANNTLKNVTNKTPRKVTSNAQKSAASNTRNYATSNAPENVASNTLETVASNTRRYATRNAPENVVSNAPENVASNAPENVASNTRKYAMRNARGRFTTRNAPENVASNKRKAVTSNTPENNEDAGDGDGDGGNDNLTVPQLEQKQAELVTQILTLLNPRDQERYSEFVAEEPKRSLKGGAKRRHKIRQMVHNLFRKYPEQRRELTKLHNQMVKCQHATEEKEGAHLPMFGKVE